MLEHDIEEALGVVRPSGPWRAQCGRSRPRHTWGNCRPSCHYKPTVGSVGVHGPAQRRRRQGLGRSMTRRTTPPPFKGFDYYFSCLIKYNGSLLQCKYFFNVSRLFVGCVPTHTKTNEHLNDLNGQEKRIKIGSNDSKEKRWS